MILIELRPYQEEIIDNVKASMIKGNKRIIVQASCGSGKSVVQGTIAKMTTDKNNRVLFLVHRRELCEQIKDTFTRCGVDWNLCQVEMIQTARRHLNDIGYPKLILIDECHTNLSAYKKLVEKFTLSTVLGFTATPCRISGSLGDIYQDIIKSVSTRWLIDNNYLSDYRYYSFALADMKGVHIQQGEYKADEVNALMERKAVYEGAVEQYLKFANGKKTMVYCSSVKASKETTEEFNRNGIAAYHLDGTASKQEREEIVNKFRRGEIQVLCNAELFSVGFDDKSIECVILLRPTMSLALFIQQSMRCMRYAEGKTAIIIDCVGNYTRFGLPDDDREWTLAKKEEKENIIKIRECKKCFGVFSPKLDKCPYCGQVAEHETRTKNKKKSVSVDLIEIQRREKIRTTKLSDAHFETWDEVREYQSVRKLKFAFCLHYCIEHNIKIPDKYQYMARRFIR